MLAEKQLSNIYKYITAAYIKMLLFSNDVYFFDTGDLNKLCNYYLDRQLMASTKYVISILYFK